MDARKAGVSTLAYSDRLHVTLDFPIFVFWWDGTRGDVELSLGKIRGQSFMYEMGFHCVAYPTTHVGRIISIHIYIFISIHTSIYIYIYTYHL